MKKKHSRKGWIQIRIEITKLTWKSRMYLIKAVTFSKPRPEKMLQQNQIFFFSHIFFFYLIKRWWMKFRIDLCWYNSIHLKNLNFSFSWSWYVYLQSLSQRVGTVFFKRYHVCIFYWCCSCLGLNLDVKIVYPENC